MPFVPSAVTSRWSEQTQGKILRPDENLETLEIYSRDILKIAGRDCRDMCPWELPPLEGRYHLISTNKAIPLAAACTGCRFISAYPLAPSTGIITFLVKEQARLGFLPNRPKRKSPRLKREEIEKILSEFVIRKHD